MTDGGVRKSESEVARVKETLRDKVRESRVTLTL
jgi:hypothetical protein